MLVYLAFLPNFLSFYLINYKMVLKKNQFNVNSKMNQESTVRENSRIVPTLLNGEKNVR